MEILLFAGGGYLALFDSWQQLPECQQSRKGNAVLIYDNDHLYSIGGFGDGHCLSSVECLSVGKGILENVKPLQIPRNWLSAVSCNGCIYAIGGKSGEGNDTRLKSVETYNTSKDEWCYVSDMNFERSSCSACVLQGRIFVVGGFNAAGTVIEEIECYDPLLDKWSIVGKTEDKLCKHSLIVV